MHLIIDGYGGDPLKMGDPDLLRGFLDRYPAALGMTKISPPFILNYAGPKEEDWGLSGFVFIAESHISIHTFPQRGYVNVDVFSCKEFDAEQALGDVKELFSLKEVRSWILDRGLEGLDRGVVRKEG